MGHGDIAATNMGVGIRRIVPMPATELGCFYAGVGLTRLS